MADVTDPFEDPTPRVSKHASIASFRARLVMIEPVQVERNVPKIASQPNGPKSDKVIVDVTVLDGKGPVQVWDRFTPTDVWLDGPVFRKVWFNQTQVTDALQTPDGKSLRGRVLCRLDTLKPGTSQGEGNPWTVTACSPEEKRAAAAELARIQLAEQDVDPFAPGGNGQAPF